MLNKKNFSFLLLVLLILFASELCAQHNKNLAIPAGYYDAAAGKSGTALKSALHHIIKGHTRYPYTSSSTDVWDILKESDEDTTNSNNVILLYSGRSQSKNANSSHGNNPDYWNREHVWPKSHGFPSSNDTAYTDTHHLRPTDASVNSSRGNKDFDNGGSPHSEAIGCRSDSDSWEPRDAVKGDVARMIFYMAVRYEEDGAYDLEMVESIPSSGPNLAKKSVLLEWHNQDPVDAWERRRNEVIYGYQNNRNPFIDHPEYAAQIWGGGSTKAEPSNHPTAFNAVENGLSINITWTDATGAVLPDNYLIKASSSGYGAISDPVDGVVEATDNSLADGSAVVHVSAGSESYTFSGLSTTTSYYFKIYGYTNAGAITDYKTDGTVESATAQTGTSGGGGAITELFISEYVEGNSNNKYIEIYNGTAQSINLTDYYIDIYFNGSLNAGNTINLSGTIAANDVFVIAHSSANGWSGTADATSGALTFNGNDAVVLRKNSQDLDILGQVGSSSNYAKDTTLKRKAFVVGPKNSYESGDWEEAAYHYDGLGSHVSDGSLPVDLIAFSLIPASTQIKINWETAAESENLGFIIKRKEAGEAAQTIADFNSHAALKGMGNSSFGKKYSFIDEKAAAQTRYTYYLYDVSYAGEVTMIAQASLFFTGERSGTAYLPEQSQLFTNYPNPFNPQTTIPFNLKQAGWVKLTIYSALGRKIEQLYNGYLEGGSHKFVWNGRNAMGIEVASGTYMCILKTEDITHSLRLHLIR